MSKITVNGRVGQSQILAVASNRHIGLRNDDEGEAFAFAVIVPRGDVDEERGIEGGDPASVRLEKELEGSREEDPAGGVGYVQDAAAAASVGSDLECIGADCRGILDIEAAVIGAGEGAVISGEVFELLGVRNGGEKEEEDDQDGRKRSHDIYICRPWF